MAKRALQSTSTAPAAKKAKVVASVQDSAASGTGTKSILKKQNQALSTKNSNSKNKGANGNARNSSKNDGQKKNSAISFADPPNAKSKGKGKAVTLETTETAAAEETSPNLTLDSLVGSGLKKSTITAFEIVTGSYERLLYGLHCSPSGGINNSASNGMSENDVQVHMEPIFQFPAHLTGIKTVAASPNARWLATGSADEVVKVWDLRRRKEVGGLVGHEGDITSLTFPSDKYLVSASADGTICLFRTKDWSMLRRFKGHKGRINSIAVHPQGRVALSVGKDRCLRMWDLLGRSTGKSSSSTKLGAEADLVRWNTTGDKFAIILDRELRLFTTDLTPLQTLTSRSRFQDVIFSDIVGGIEVFLIACEDGKVRIYKSPERPLDEDDDEDDDHDAEKNEGEHFAELVGHTNRVKGLSIVEVLGQKLVVTISSDGTIKTFALSSLQTPSTSPSNEADASIQTLEAISTYDTKGSRLTCVAAVPVGNDRTTYADSVVDPGDLSSGSDLSDSDGEDAEELEDDEEDDEEEEFEGFGGLDEEEDELELEEEEALDAEDSDSDGDNDERS